MKIKTTMATPHYLAHMALIHRLHARGLLWIELTQILKGQTHDIALVYVDGEPACVVVLTDYSQLMAFTKRKYRRLGLATRATKLISRRTGCPLNLMLGGVGKVASVSRGFFESLNVELSDEFDR